jgi:hypothetical protein
VAIDVIQANFHQWAVASNFDAATFAIYAVGCLQIPLVDVVCSSTANVMMVRMAEADGEHRGSALRLWHDTTARLALLIFPLAAFFLLNAHAVITFLFTTRYLASVQIFRVWCLMILPSVFAVDAVLRVYGQTRSLVVLNAVRLALIAGLIGWFMSTFGLIGAVLVTLIATSLVKAAAVLRIARLLHVGVADVLPWRRLAAAAVHAGIAVVPAVVGHALSIAAASGGADLECRGVRHVVRGHLVPARAVEAARRPIGSSARAVGLPERGSLTRGSYRVWHSRHREVRRPTRPRRRRASDVPGDGASRTGRGRRLPRRGRGPRHAPIEHHRPGGRATADLERRRLDLGRVQRRDLQPSRTPPAADARRPHVPYGERHGNDRPSYEDLGARAVERLRGMFAFALWDAPRRQLLLARDRLGIKPLYYADLDDGVVFASELKPILQRPDIGRDLNWEAVGHLFTFLATPSSSSIVKGVRKLEPARFATAADRRGVAVERYWDVEFQPDEHSSEDELVEQLRELLVESVRLHQISDVPIGAFLSGGIDSSAVVATMAQLTSSPVKTFAIGFVEEDYSELDHARRVAEQFGTDHHELILRPDVVQIAEDLAWYLDEPFGDTSAIPTYMVSKLASEHVTVVLTGDGGDELFAGYDKYVTEERERRYDRVPDSIRKVLGAVGRAMPEGMTGRRFLRHLALNGSRRYPRRLHALPNRRIAPGVSTRGVQSDRRSRSMGSFAHGAREHRLRLGGRASVLRPPDLPAARHPHQGRSHDDGALD